jgi:CheY-like chemotaxis protein/HPt (histidine-containing phosphotransfer) domain-containing protein
VFYEEEVDEIRSDHIPTIEEARSQGELILVAEDNLTNQDVITRQLNMLGYACVMADDGEQALAIWRSEDFAILLTDCHMPNMDGFELVAAIRQDEKVKSLSRKPIVAITANALQGEAERCIAAGMDDYLSKPLKLQDLRTMVRKWLGVDGSTTKTIKIAHKDSTARAKSNADMPIDDSVVKDIFGDDEEMFREVLDSFIGPSAVIIDELKQAYATQSCDEVQAAAHKLKSSARSIGANELADICTALETAGKENDLETIGQLMPRLEPAFEEVKNYISSLS